MFKLFLVLIGLWVPPGLLPPGGFDLENKTLQKELEKIGGNSNSNFKEMAVPESLLISNPVQGKFLALTGQEPPATYVYAGRVNSCRQGGCSNALQTMSVETPEFFEYLIVFDANLTVRQVKVYNYQATHGQEVTNKGWLKQFQGYDGKRPLTAGKSIDAISGATVSVNGIINDIQGKTTLLKKLANK